MIGSLIKFAMCFLAGLGTGSGTGFAGMSAAAVISPVLITFLHMDPYMAVGSICGFLGASGVVLMVLGVVVLGVKFFSRFSAGSTKEKLPCAPGNAALSPAR